MKKTIVVVFLLLVLCCIGAYAAVPVANAGPDQTVLEDYGVTLNGSASSGYTFIKWTQTAGPITVTLSDSTAIQPTFTPAEPGVYEFRLEVRNETNSSATDTVAITVKQVLKIRNIDIKVGSKTDKNLENKLDGYRIREEAKPEDTVKFDVEVESLLDRNIQEEDFDIQNIVITVTIYSIDDTDDLEEESKEFDLRPDKRHSESLQFQVPLKVDEGDYDVLINIDGEDENGVEHIIEKKMILVVQKDRHYIKIDKLNLNPSTLKCSRTATLDTQIMNLGRDDEDEVSIEIINEDLSINSKTTQIELSSNWEDDDNTFEKTLTITLPDDFKTGTYPISVKTYYDSKESESKTIDLIVEDCKPAITEPTPEEEPEEGTVVVVPKEEIPEEVVPAEPIIEEQKLPAFMQSSEFYTLVVIVIVLVIGLIIFLIGAFVIRASKKER